MHGNGLFITHYGDRYQGRFHNDRFLNQSGQWVVPQVIPPDEVAAAFKVRPRLFNICFFFFIVLHCLSVCVLFESVGRCLRVMHVHLIPYLLLFSPHLQMIASLEPRPIPTMAPVFPEGMMKRKDEEAADAGQLAGSEVQAAST